MNTRTGMPAAGLPGPGLPGPGLAGSPLCSLLIPCRPPPSRTANDHASILTAQPLQQGYSSKCGAEIGRASDMSPMRGAGPSFLAKLILSVFAQVGRGAAGPGAYDLTAGC